MSLCETLGIEYPIFCGAMARISLHELVGAVSEAGGIGILASGGMTAEQLREEIHKTREITQKPFGVNLMLQMDNIPELVEVIVEEKVALVTTGAGGPAPYIPTLKEAGIKVFPVIASVKHATKMEKAGADGVIAEGQEAGGHIGSVSTMSLIPQIVDAVDIPVIAAGGTGDGRTVAAMYALGVQGIQAGTIFLASEECQIAQSYKEAIVEAIDTGTIVTGRKAKDPVRSLKTPMLEKFLHLEQNNGSFEDLEHLTVGSLKRAVDGDLENGTPMCGEIAGLITEIRPVREIIESLFTEADQVAKDLTITK
ncbi:nitronate monooxygenase [Aerococcaceae bacterium DSM 111020]|nr:nitronate monooxygenase [Aerococcaceae bacterium DSM 111020]